MEKIDISGFNPVKLLNIGTVNTLINNLSNIQNQLGKDLDDVTLFYRGHADKSWELIPGIYRNNRFINKEDFLVHNLIRHCPVDFQSCNSSFEKLVKMQHYELPTRLLDISMNPLVGLYFAVCSEMDKDGELIADNAIKVADNAAYYYERYWSKGYQLRREILCDAYIVAGIYINIVLHPVFMELFQTKYPSLFDKEKYPFLFREEDLFSDAQKESLSKLSLKSELKCFDYSLDNLSLELVYKALKDREIINSKKYVSNVAVYFDEKYLFDYVFIYLFEVKLYNKMAGKLYSYNRVLYVPFEFFKTKDWSLVENVEKHGEPYKNENMPSGIEFITEKQGNAGYFNTDLVKKIKEVLLAL